MVNTSTLAIANFISVLNAGNRSESIAITRNGLFNYVGRTALVARQSAQVVAVVDTLTFKVAGSACLGLQSLFTSHGGGR